MANSRKPTQHEAQDLNATHDPYPEGAGVEEAHGSRTRESRGTQPRRPDPFAVPDWLNDAWLSGQNYVGRSDDELLQEIARHEKSQMRAKLTGEVEEGPEPYWNWWFYASLLAIAGRRRAIAQLRESDAEYRELHDAVQNKTRRRFQERRARGRNPEGVSQEQPPLEQ